MRTIFIVLTIAAVLAGLFGVAENDYSKQWAGFVGAAVFATLAYWAGRK